MTKKYLFYFKINDVGTTDGGYCESIDELIERIKIQAEQIKHQHGMEININLKILWLNDIHEKMHILYKKMYEKEYDKHFDNERWIYM